jgi:hypothetical protein
VSDCPRLPDRQCSSTVSFTFFFNALIHKSGSGRRCVHWARGERKGGSCGRQWICRCRQAPCNVRSCVAGSSSAGSIRSVLPFANAPHMGLQPIPAQKQERLVSTL